jgi:hypothetical protein
MAANASAAAWPMPDVAPVMTQVFPTMLGEYAGGLASIASRKN